MGTMETLPTSPSSSSSLPSTVVIAQLCRSPDFQVRKKLCPQTVQRYAAAIKAGQELPPLQVAVVDGVPCLVDGYHRAAALEQLGCPTAEATITETTREEAQWRAAKANLTHGLPLKNSEIRNVFRVYIRSGRHKKGSGRLKSYREISLELGRPHTTLRLWMEKDFPKLFFQYSGPSYAADGGYQPLALRPPQQAQVAIDHLENARQALQGISCPNAREAARDHLQRFAEDVLGSNWMTSRDF